MFAQDYHMFQCIYDIHEAMLGMNYNKRKKRENTPETFMLNVLRCVQSKNVKENIRNVGNTYVFSCGCKMFISELLWKQSGAREFSNFVIVSQSVECMYCQTGQDKYRVVTLAVRRHRDNFCCYAFLHSSPIVSYVEFRMQVCQYFDMTCSRVIQETEISRSNFQYFVN